MFKNASKGSNEMSKENKKVRVAIIGIGNCANSFIQGLQYYKDAADDADGSAATGVDAATTGANPAAEPSDGTVDAASTRI